MLSDISAISSSSSSSSTYVLPSVAECFSTSNTAKSLIYIQLKTDEILEFKMAYREQPWCKLAAP